MRYLLDTNIVSHLLKQHPIVARHVIDVPMSMLCISSITEGELLFGLAKRPEAKRLHELVHAFLLRVDVLPWNSAIAKYYGIMRAHLACQGKTVGALDQLIAAHALGTKSVLVTNDQTFNYIPDLAIEDWTLA